MKKFVLLVLIVAFQFQYSDAFSQTLEKAVLIEQLVKVYNPDKTIFYNKTEYNIECEFGNSGRENLKEDVVRNVDNWQVSREDKVFPIDRLLWREIKPEKVVLIGPYDDEDRLSVSFSGGKPILVNVESATIGKTNFGFGKGKAFDFNAQRLTKQSALFAFDYDIEVNVVERNLMIPKGSLWFRSLSLNLTSKGTFASDDTVRNGTQSSVGLALNPFYFVAGLIYRSELNFSYQIETKMNEAEDRLFDVIDKKLKLGAEIEVPLTNYPIFKLHTVTGYARLAMPLTVRVDYLFGGEGDDGSDNLDRLDFKTRYELAFSPYLIIQGEWHRSNFFDAPAGFDDIAIYHSIAFAQDLDAVKKTLGFLKFILGPEEEIRGKNFIFFRISNGRKAPAFEDIDETAIGFGTYF